MPTELGRARYAATTRSVISSPTELWHWVLLHLLAG